jgi:hypothetical protein
MQRCIPKFQEEALAALSDGEKVDCILGRGCPRRDIESTVGLAQAGRNLLTS